MGNRTAAVVLALVLAGACSPIQIRTEIEIDAPPSEVYAILADFPSYPEWNPYHVRVEGEFREGADLEVLVHRPDGEEVHVPPHILRIVPDREITWGGGIKGIFWGEHVFLLEEVAGGTRLIHNEDFTGFAIHFADLPPEVLTEGYRLMNEALKVRAEAATAAP